MRGMMSKGMSRSDASSAAVDREGDAGAAEQRLRLHELALEVVELLRLEPIGDRLIGHTHPIAGTVHLIESRAQCRLASQPAFFNVRHKSTRNCRAAAHPH